MGAPDMGYGQPMQMPDNRAFGYGFPVRDLPTPEDCANLLQNQVSLMQQLEIENKYIRVSKRDKPPIDMMKA